MQDVSHDHTRREADADEPRLPAKPTTRAANAPSAPDVYALVTDRITNALEAGTVPWHKPWAAAGGIPRNLTSGRPYRGMNVLLLSLGQPFESPWWLTFKQALDLGGHVRKGERSSIVTFWKFRDAKSDADTGTDTPEATTERRAPLLRYYHVFNVAQCDGVEPPPSEEIQPKDHERIARCEAVVVGMPQRPVVQRDPRKAFYTPAFDFVGMPDLSRFETPESYYATLFHELIHSTGHASRLARPFLGVPGAFGSPEYSKEELVAEFGAAFLCAHSGIFPSTVENQAAYINGWLAALKKDKRLLSVAAAHAQRAADFILGAQPNSEEPAPAPSSPTPETGQASPSCGPQQLDIRRVATLIAADPDFQGGMNTFPRCQERNRRESWCYRSGNPNRVVESFIRLNSEALDRAYELARAFQRGDLDLRCLL
jgi:antirestriction protein ArdC